MRSMSNQDTLQQINAIINNLKDKFTPNQQLMTSIAEEMKASVENNFATQGNGSWPALQPSTIKQKEKKGFARSMLRAQDFLYKSIHSSSTENSAIVSTNKPYAAIHQFGGTISIAARTRTLFHRTDAKGNLLTQKSNDKLLVFAKASHKRKAAYTFGQKNYNITIPPRPFMVLTDKYTNNIINIIRQHVLSS